MKVFLSTGEVSGDVAAAHLVRRLRGLDASLEAYGIGGERMADAGVTVDFPTNHLGTVGVTEAFVALPSFARALLAVRRRIKIAEPDVAVLIGNDLFNALLGRWLRRHGVPTVAYFPPQVWLWRAIARLITGSFDAVLTCFPEEQEVYGGVAPRVGTEVRYVGHYLCELLPPRTPSDQAAARRSLGLTAASSVIGVLPGSRGHEIRAIGTLLLGAAGRLAAEDPTLGLVVPIAEQRFRPAVLNAIARAGLGGRTVVTNDSHAAMRAADFLLIASGTASLEAALIGVPMIVAYRVSRATYAIIRVAMALGLLRSDTVGLPNLVLGDGTVPELRQHDVSVGRIAATARALLEQPERMAAMVESFGAIRAQLGRPDALGAAARAIREVALGRPMPDWE